jgi:hypothetical protein
MKVVTEFICLSRRDLLNCDAVYCRSRIPTFRSTVLPPSSGREMETAWFPETLVSYQKTTRRQILEGLDLNLHRRENLRSFKFLAFISNFVTERERFLTCRFRSKTFFIFSIKREIVTVFWVPFVHNKCMSFCLCLFLRA